MNNYPASIGELLKLPRSRFFGIACEDGAYTAKDEVSFFGKTLPDPEASFDISNNKALVNVGLTGAISHLSVYNGNYATDNIPGVWMCKSFTRAGPFSFRLDLGDGPQELDRLALSYESSLLDNIVPITELTLPAARAALLTFAPVSADGETRLRCAVHGLYLENTSASVLQAVAWLPSPSTAEAELFDRAEFVVHPADTDERGLEVALTLQPGQAAWIPAIIYPPGELGLKERLERQGSAYWLAETLAYFRRMLGRLSMEQDPYTAEFLERALLQCFHSIGMDRDGRVIGSNWGSYPTTEFIWSKDMYYSFLPFYTLEPELFKKGMLWFADYGVRPPGNRYEGGIEHSLSNSMSAVVMAGLYYQSTGDKRLFLNDPRLDLKLRDVLESTLRTRADGDPWLFPSVWLSDAYSLGDYHTGSNVMAWAAFSYYARVVLEVYGDRAAADRYADIAERIRGDLERIGTIEGPLGPQYAEGIAAGGPDPLSLSADRYAGVYRDFGLQFVPNLLRDGHINLLHHDGEESDTTLMPFYGYAPYDHQPYANYMRFSLSPANPTYNPESRGIQWGDHSACTFPGYMSGMGMITSADSLSGPAGYLTEVRRLTDVDGSLWWWPYRNGAAYGDVVRHNTCGKCGWASGVFSALFMSQMLGLSYDAPEKRLRLRPFSPSSSFVWNAVRLGDQTFDIAYRRENGQAIAIVRNLGRQPVEAVVELPGGEAATGASDESGETKRWNGLVLHTLSAILQPGETKQFSIAITAACG